MTALWTSDAAALATGGKANGQWHVEGISIDSREIAKGDLFVALKDVRDGHEFVAAALRSGAAAALVSHMPEGLDEGAPLLVVPDVLAALEDLGRAARARTNAKVVAITGSAGKTSTKEMLREILCRQGKTHAAERSFNNHWGVPLTLARMPQDSDFAIIEIGMNHPGEIAPLSKMARPHVAMVTNVAAAHLEAFEDVGGIAREKATICAGLEPDGRQIICADVEAAARNILDQEMSEDHPRIWYGAADDAQWHLSKFKQMPDQSIVQAAAAEVGDFIYKLNAPGRHFAINSLGALAVVHAVGAEVVVASHDLGAWAPPAGRGKRETIVLDVVYDEMTFELFDDAFNANPMSMQAALDVLAVTKPVHDVGRVQKGRRIAILGDMLELGETEDRLHSDIATTKAIKKVDLVHTVGPRMYHLHQALKQKRRGQHFADAQEASASAHHLIDAGDVVLVKGSKGSKVSLVVDAIRKLGHPQAKDE